MMREILKTKSYCIIIFVLGCWIVFNKVSMLLNPGYNSFLLLIKCFGITLFIFYLIFMLAFTIELLLFNIGNIAKIQHLSIYPFTYDGTWRCHPIKLLFHAEAFRDTFELNLISFVNDYETLKRKFKLVLRIRKLSLFISFILIQLILYVLFQWNLIIEFTISYGCFVLFSFFDFSDYWEGNDSIYHNHKVQRYYYIEKCIKQFDAKDYCNWIGQRIDQSDIAVGEWLSLLENYVYRCIYEGVTPLSISSIRKIINKISPEDHVIYFDLGKDVRLQNIIKLIGLVGKHYNEEYLQYATLRLTIHKDYLLENQSKHVDRAIEMLNTYIGYINGEVVCIELLEHLTLRTKDIFSFYEVIEKRVLSL